MDKAQRLIPPFFVLSAGYLLNQWAENKSRFLDRSFLRVPNEKYTVVNSQLKYHRAFHPGWYLHLQVNNNLNQPYHYSFPLSDDASQRFSFSPKPPSNISDSLTAPPNNTEITAQQLSVLHNTHSALQIQQQEHLEFLSTIGKVTIGLASLRILGTVVPITHLLTTLSIIVGSYTAYTAFQKHKQLKKISTWPVESLPILAYSLSYKRSSPLITPGWFLDLEVGHKPAPPSPLSTTPSSTSSNTASSSSSSSPPPSIPSSPWALTSHHSFRLTRDWVAFSSPQGSPPEQVQSTMLSNLPGNTVFCRMAPNEADERLFVELNGKDSTALANEIWKMKLACALGGGLCASAIVREVLGCLRRFV